jgi:hypothetical protein
MRHIDLFTGMLGFSEALRRAFPDSWLDGLGLSDSAKYRMIGNSIALPVVEWIARRIAAHDSVVTEMM